MAETTEDAVAAPAAWGFMDGAYLWMDVDLERLVSAHDARGRSFPLYALGTDPAIATLTAENARLQAEVDAMRADRDAAAEDERDRLYAKANADYIEAEKRGDAIAQELHSTAAFWLGFNGGKSQTDRTLATQEKRP